MASSGFLLAHHIHYWIKYAEHIMHFMTFMERESVLKVFTVQLMYFTEKRIQMRKKSRYRYEKTNYKTIIGNKSPQWSRSVADAAAVCIWRQTRTKLTCNIIFTFDMPFHLIIWPFVHTCKIDCDSKTKGHALAHMTSNVDSAFTHWSMDSVYLRT